MIKNITPRLAEAGKIKIGGLGQERKAKNGNTFRAPLKFDHFVITRTTRNEKGDLEIDEDLMDVLDADADGQIRELPIVLHSDDIDEVFPTSYALYSGKKCVCRGDGESAVMREIKDKKFTGAEKPRECPCSYLGATSGPICKPNGKLFCSIAAPSAAVAGAVHIWRTTSIISIEQMVGSLTQIRSVCGALRGIPLVLRVKPIQVEPDGSGTITVYVCHVELRAADVQAVQVRAIEAAKLRRELGGVLDADAAAYRKLLVAAQNESEREQEDVAEEFYAEDEANVAPAKRAVKAASSSDITDAIRERAAEPEPSPPADLETGRKEGDLL